MKKLWLGVLVMPAQLIHAQEVKHAPPRVAQCQADQRLWIDKLERPNLGVEVSYPELNGWTTEMLNCETVIPRTECCTTTRLVSPVLIRQ
jgi:hypothetical protein